MTGPQQLISDFLRSWMPWVTVGTLLWKTWSNAKTQIVTFANRLLDNHFQHLQKSLDSIDSAQQIQIQLLTKLLDK